MTPESQATGHSFHRPRRRVEGKGFTLIELLVVVAILAVVMGVLLPSLAGARVMARQARELSAARQLSTAYSLYADEHRGTLMPGYATVAMTSDPPINGQPTLVVLNQDGQPIVNSPAARRYPWRLYPYLDYNFAGLYFDPAVLTHYVTNDQFQYIVSLIPSMGLNSTFCGGDDDRYGFSPSALQTLGTFYVTRISQPEFPARLLTFVSARGPDPDAGATGSVPGYFRVDSPYLFQRQWSPHFDADAPPQSFGHVDLRYRSKAVTAAFDGHAEPMGEADLQDMRRWADRATRADWTLAP